MAFLDNQYLLDSETAFALYNEIAALPIIDPHNHADVAQIASNTKFTNPWQLFAATDHYMWEVMRKRGVPEQLITGTADDKEKWKELARVFPQFVGNPIYEWVHLDLRTLGISDVLLSEKTAEDIWEQAKAVLAVPASRPQQLIEKMNIEAMCSTDDPVDTLEDHEKANKAFGRQRIRPTWRPDKAMNIAAPTWKEYIEKVEKRFECKVANVSDLINALQKSHDYFAERGTVASDHGISYPVSGEATLKEADEVFAKAMNGEKMTVDEVRKFQSYLMVQFAEMNAKKGWVFQMHMGAVRDVRDCLFKNLGPDSGGDVSDHMIDIVTPVSKFLNKVDNRLKVVLYCLDPGHQASLAALSRAYGFNVRLGSAWWLNDTPVGMQRQLEYISSIDLLYSFAGMVSDSRKLLSYSSRFEMFRRTLANVVARMVNRGQIPLQQAIDLLKQVAYYGPKEFYNL